MISSIIIIAQRRSTVDRQTPWESFTPNEHYKTAIQSECHEDYFPSFCVQSYAQSDNVQFYSLKCAVGNLANGPFAKLPTARFSE